jgi:hypothetical protein
LESSFRADLFNSYKCHNCRRCDSVHSGFNGSIAFFTFLPLVVLVVSTFIYYYVMAPVAFLTETEQAVSNALSEKKTLEALQQPKLEILFENGKEPYEQRAVATGYEGRGHAIVRVAVKNISNVF